MTDKPPERGHAIGVLFYKPERWILMLNRCGGLLLVLMNTIWIEYSFLREDYSSGIKDKYMKVYHEHFMYFNRTLFFCSRGIDRCPV